MQQTFGTQGLNAELPWLPQAAAARQHPPASPVTGQMPSPWQEAEPRSTDLNHWVDKIVGAIPTHNTNRFFSPSCP